MAPTCFLSEGVSFFGLFLVLSLTACFFFFLGGGGGVERKREVREVEKPPAAAEFQFLVFYFAASGAGSGTARCVTLHALDTSIRPLFSCRGSR